MDWFKGQFTGKTMENAISNGKIYEIHWNPILWNSPTYQWSSMTWMISEVSDILGLRKRNRWFRCGRKNFLGHCCWPSQKARLFYWCFKEDLLVLFMIRDSILLMWRGYFIDVINMSVSNRHILLMLLTLFLRVFFLKLCLIASIK